LYKTIEAVFLVTDSRPTQRNKREHRDHYLKGVPKYMSKGIDYGKKYSDIQKEIDKGLAVNILF
jgi:hypothetical protein